MSTTIQSLEPWLSRGPVVLILVLGACICISAMYISLLYTQKKSIQAQKTMQPPESNSGYPPIEPLPSFKWETTDPLVFRPFKPKYHLTMGISPLPPSTLIPIDKTYKPRLDLRASLLSQHPDVVRAVNISPSNSPQTNARIRAAIREWYGFVLGVYLPGRYPSLFRVLKVQQHQQEETVYVESKVTGFRALVGGRKVDGDGDGDGDGDVYTETETETENGSDMLPLLDTLGTWIDEDFLILLPEDTSGSGSSSGEEKYILQAYTTYYPAGFDTRKKIGRRLAEIHSPVPGYKEKLERSMDRFFARLEVGRFVQRVNWSITTGETGLFAAFGGVHGDKEEDGEEEIRPGELDVESTFVRCERQTLHRLPKSKALVFAFHTYTYPIQSIKDEGLGEDLAMAIDGLKEGSVPAIHEYKRSAYWGEAVKAFLRS